MGVAEERHAAPRLRGAVAPWRRGAEPPAGSWHRPWRRGSVAPGLRGSGAPWLRGAEPPAGSWHRPWRWPRRGDGPWRRGSVARNLPPDRGAGSWLRPRRGAGLAVEVGFSATPAPAVQNRTTLRIRASGGLSRSDGGNSERRAVRIMPNRPGSTIEDGLWPSVSNLVPPPPVLRRNGRASGRASGRARGATPPTATPATPRATPRPAPRHSPHISALHALYALAAYAPCIIPAILADIPKIMHTPASMFIQLLAKPNSKRWRPCREARP